jgi:hypothetical protein
MGILSYEQKYINYALQGVTNFYWICGYVPFQKNNIKLGIIIWKNINVTKIDFNDTLDYGQRKGQTLAFKTKQTNNVISVNKKIQ